MIFDALTFPLSTGDEDLRRDAMATIEAIRRIKAEIPGALTMLGAEQRQLRAAPAAAPRTQQRVPARVLAAGLDAAIVHAGRIVPLNKLPDEQRQVCLDLIDDGARAGDDPLRRCSSVADVKSEKAVKEDRRVAGRAAAQAGGSSTATRDGLTADLDEAMAAGLAPLAIINDVLLAAMQEVGELFGAGRCSSRSCCRAPRR